MTYDQQTGDGKYMQTTLAILRQAIKENQAESTAEPGTTMRSVEGADSAGLRPETVGGEMPRLVF